jgi:DNA-binding GntR family transcriptional regulator
MARTRDLPSDRVTDDLRQRIKRGEWLPGEALPTVNALADGYQVSRATVSKALAVLRAEGLVESRERWGTFVSDQAGSW